jgi:hypothetical protein
MANAIESNNDRQREEFISSPENLSGKNRIDDKRRCGLKEMP